MPTDTSATKATAAKKATVAKKATAKKRAAAKKGVDVGASFKDASRPPAIAVGRLVKHRFHDIPSDTDVDEVGIVTEITDDGVYFVPLALATVVPADQLRAI